MIINPLRQEKKRFCREHHVTGKRYRALLKIERRKFLAAARREGIA
jgi:hypothetical protein